MTATNSATHIPDQTEVLLAEVFGLSKKFRKVPFPTAVKMSSGYSVIPIDRTSDYDKELLKNIETTLRLFLKTINTSQPRFKGNRINDVGRKIEPQLVHELNKQPLIVKQLASSGYPDIEIDFKGQISYLEMKTSSVLARSSFRYFYYTGGKKIKADARHILLTIFATPDTPGYWKLENMTLSDLSTLKVSLKTEFNANKGDLMDGHAKIFEVK